jgi:hypothetical protein
MGIRAEKRIGLLFTAGLSLEEYNKETEKMELGGNFNAPSADESR